MAMPNEPIPGASPAPQSEPSQPGGVVQARQEFFKQSPIGQPGNADRVAAIMGNLPPQPEAIAGPAPILNTEPHIDSSVDPDAPTQPYSAAELGQINTPPADPMIRNIAAAAIPTGLTEDLTQVSALPYAQEPQSQPAEPQPQTQPTPAPKKPRWKFW